MSLLDKKTGSFIDRKAVGLLDRRNIQPAIEPERVAYDPPEKLDDTLQAFRERDRAMRAKFEDMNDTECWVAVCFATRTDKDAFVEEFGLLEHPLIPGTRGDKYVNGPELVAHWRSLTEE